MTGTCKMCNKPAVASVVAKAGDQPVKVCAAHAAQMKKAVDKKAGNPSGGAGFKPAKKGENPFAKT